MLNVEVQRQFDEMRVKANVKQNWLIIYQTWLLN